MKKADERNKQYYDKRNTRPQVELKFGDFVLVKPVRTGKLDPPARGPFQFLRYLNKDRLSAELINPS